MNGFCILFGQEVCLGMPNWIEGTMKVRGKAEDLIRFFENGFDAPVKMDI